MRYWEHISPACMTEESDSEQGERIVTHQLMWRSECELWRRPVFFFNCPPFFVIALRLLRFGVCVDFGSNVLRWVLDNGRCVSI